MIDKPAEELYPKWTPAEEVDRQVDNLIQDIVNGMFDSTSWEADIVAAKDKRKRKKKVIDDEDDGKNMIAKKLQKTEEVASAKKETQTVSYS